MMRHRTILKSTLLVLLVWVATMWISVPAGAKSAESTQQFASHPGTSKSYRPSGSSHSSPSHTINLADTPQVHGHVYPIPAHRYGPMPKTQPIATPNQGATILPVPNTPANVSPATPYPLIGSSFSGIGDTGVAPSDSMNAVSATNVVETVNERFSVYSRSGTALYSTDLQTFFGAGNFDPRVAYDTWGNRFVIVSDTNSSFLLAVSADSTGLNNWCQYSFTASPGFLDYPMIGIDSKNIYLAANDDGANNNEIIEINRASVENSCGGSPTWNDWVNIPDAEGAAGFLFINPIVETVRDGSNSEYMISSHYSGDCSLTLWTINGTTLTTTLVPTGCYTPPSVNPAQANTTATLDTGGSRIIGASYINGVISTGLTTDYVWSSGNHTSAVYWWQILPNGTVAREKIVGNSNWWYYYPNFQQDESGDTILVLNTSTTYSYVNIWFYVFDPSGNVVGNNGIQWGTGPYGSSGTTARWGDLNSIMIDPTGPGNDVWICGQYATSTGLWGTWNAQITA